MSHRDSSNGRNIWRNESEFRLLEAHAYLKLFDLGLQAFLISLFDHLSWT